MLVGMSIGNSPDVVARREPGVWSSWAGPKRHERRAAWGGAGEALACWPAGGRGIGCLASGRIQGVDRSLPRPACGCGSRFPFVAVGGRSKQISRGAETFLSPPQESDTECLTNLRPQAGASYGSKPVPLLVLTRCGTNQPFINNNGRRVIHFWHTVQGW